MIFKHFYKFAGIEKALIFFMIRIISPKNEQNNKEANKSISEAQYPR
jgi:hypothetical protein